MSRSKWKGPYISKKLLKTKTYSAQKPLTIWARNSTIPSKLINKLVLIHTGKTFKKILITREKVGYKFGEFAPTRQYCKHKKVKKENK